MRHTNERERRKRVWSQEPSCNDHVTIRCAACEADIDLSRGTDGISTRYGHVRGWLCETCAYDYHARPVVNLDAQQRSRKFNQLGTVVKSVHANTAIQRKAAEKLQDYLDYCDVANLLPDPDTIYRIEAKISVQRQYGMVKVREVLKASAGWAHYRDGWPQWHDGPTLKVAARELRGKQTQRRSDKSAGFWRPADYHTGLSRLIDEALASARRVHWTPVPARIVVDSRRYPPYEAPVLWSMPLSLPDTPMLPVLPGPIEIADIVRSALADARTYHTTPRVTFGESSRTVPSQAVCIAYHPWDRR